jgi:hypothetical protein
VLLEIGCWRPLQSMDVKGNKFEYIKDPEKLRDILLFNALPRLEHAAGFSFGTAVKACFHRTMWKKLNDWHHQQKFRAEVLLPMSI